MRLDHLLSKESYCSTRGLACGVSSLEDSQLITGRSIRARRALGLIGTMRQSARRAALAVVCTDVSVPFSGGVSPLPRRSRRRSLRGAASVVSPGYSNASASRRPLAHFENFIASTSIFNSPSYKEPTVDALAPEADEGRGWLRKATGSCRPSVDP